MHRARLFTLPFSILLIAAFFTPRAALAQARPPDALKVAYIRHSSPSTVGGPKGRIFTAFIDGSGSQPLTLKDEILGQIAWSPTANEIAVTKPSANVGPSWDVFLVDAQTGATSQVTTTGNQAIAGITWAPDGSRIAFAATPSAAIVGPAVPNFDIWTVKPDGTDLTRVTSTPADEMFPTWSPDGGKMAYQDAGGLFVMNADGTGVSKITDGVDGSPAWSPDGSMIAYSRGAAKSRDVYEVAPTGGPVTQLTSGPADDGDSAWTLDGRISFTRTRGPGGLRQHVLVMNADGTNVTRLPLGSNAVCCATWGILSSPIP